MTARFFRFSFSKCLDYAEKAHFLLFWPRTAIFFLQVIYKTIFTWITYYSDNLEENNCARIFNVSFWLPGGQFVNYFQISMLSYCVLNGIKRIDIINYVRNIYSSSARDQNIFVILQYLEKFQNNFKKNLAIFYFSNYNISKQATQNSKIKKLGLYLC
jgi:hypothetical protein